jgi:hypothetical protein
MNGVSKRRAIVRLAGLSSVLMCAVVCAASAQQSLPLEFQFRPTSGPGYEGVIIPALPPSAFAKPGDPEHWTPQPSDVALAERRLTAFLELAAREPSQVAETITNQSVTLPGIPTVLASLATYKRQYTGLRYDGVRRVLVYGFPDDPAHLWRSDPVMVMGGGCHYWWFDFNLDEQRVIRFNCQGDE